MNGDLSRADPASTEVRPSGTDGSGASGTGPADSSATVEETSRSLLRRIVIYLPGSVVPAVLALVTSMVFTRVFSAAEFGMFSLAAVVIAAPLKVITTTWLVQSVGKFIPPLASDDERRDVLDAVVLATVLIVLAEVALGGVAYVVGHYLLADQWRAFLLPVVLFVIATSLFEIASAVFTAQARASDYTAFKLSDSVLTLTLRLVLVSGLVGMDVTLMVWSVVISNALLVPLMWRRIGLASPMRAVALRRSPTTTRLTRSFVGFGFPMTMWLFASIMLDVGDRWVIKVLIGSEAVGIYDASYRLIAGLAALMVVPVTITVHPYVMSLADGIEDERAGKVIGTVVDHLAVVAMLSVGLTFVLRHDIALVLLGPEFRDGAKIMPVVLAGVFLANIGTFAHKPFEIVGRTRPMVVTAFAAAAANLLLCFLLIPVMGYAGAAYATLIAYLLYTVTVGALGRRLIPWRVNVRRVAGQGLVVLVAFGAIEGLRWYTHPPYAVDLIGTALASLLVAGVLLWRLVRRRDDVLDEEVAP